MSATTNRPGTLTHASEELVCHCRQVPYETVRQAVRSGKATTLPQVQQKTTACTRCFGCRFEIENLLKEELGDRYVPTAVVTRDAIGTPDGLRGRVREALTRVRRWSAPTPQPKMYMPVLENFNGSDVTTRVVLFNLHDERTQEAATVSLRADLTRLDGTREDVWQASIPPKQTTALDVRETAAELPDGIGVIKLVLDAESIGSLRPYFQFISPGGITSTHEKRSPSRPAKRTYHWIFPIAPKARPDEAWFFAVNTLPTPIDGCRMSFRGDDGTEESVDLPKLELDQAVCVPLHEHFRAIREGTASGSVRITPSVHVAGWIIRRDVEADLWRVQHL